VTGSPALVLALALALDLLLGDPPNRLHPVSWLGNLLVWGRRRLRARSAAGQLAAGTVLVGAVVAAAAGPAALVNRWDPRWVWPGVLVEAWLLKCAFAVRGLFAAVGSVERALAAGDLEGARAAAGRDLVSRPTAELSGGEVAAAAVESLAENLTDSVVAPLLFFAVGGLPAAWAYRAANTADAMIGYRTAELEYLGKAAARLDDALSYVPARLAALALLAGAWLGGGSAGRAWAIMRRDSGLCASPNAGRTMATMAGALGVRLDKRGHYRLGDGPLPSVADIGRARRVAAWATAIAAAAALGALATPGRLK
jgi:adenosylcobinamide-phosphate synthase